VVLLPKALLESTAAGSFSQAEADHRAHLRRRAEWEVEHGQKLRGRKPIGPDPDGLGARKINTTDPDSRTIMRTGRATVQGYNVQAVATESQIVVAAEVSQQPVDSGLLEPMVRHTITSLHQAGVDATGATVLADGGYWSAPQIGALREDGITAIVPTKALRRTVARKLAKKGPEAERIEQLLDTPDGKTLYRRRQQMIEPVFAHTKFIRGITRFHRRGLAACHSEWRLIAATHNLLKLYRAQIAF